MEGAILTGTSQKAAGDGAVRGEQLPLSFLQRGQTAVVAKVRGNDEIHHHLENLGFVEGAEVKVVNENGGNLIVEVKGAQVALDKKAATKIITQ